MKKRLFVLFMAAVVGFTGMPVTFANAADDAVVNTSEDDQPDACKTVSGNYGVTIDKDKKKFESALTDELSKNLYAKFKEILVTNPWKENKEIKNSEEGSYIELKVVNLSVPGDYTPNSGKYINYKDEPVAKVTGARDGFIAAVFSSVNVLMNTYPTELAGIDFTKLSFSGEISNDASVTDMTVKIFIDNNWKNDYVDSADKVVKDILTEADEYVKNNKQFENNTDLGRIVYFDQWLVNNVEISSDSKDVMTNTQYGAFVEKKAGDEGYALALSVLLDKIGVENEVVYGSTNFNGSGYGYWNIVKVKNNNTEAFYVIDSCANDYAKEQYNSDEEINNMNRPYLLIGKASYTSSYYLSGNGQFFSNDRIADKIVKITYSDVSENNYFNSTVFDNAVVLAKKKSGKLFGKNTEKLKQYNREKRQYKSNNESVVKVSKKGVLKAVGPGKATITITKEGSESTETVDVYVYNVNSLVFSNQANTNNVVMGMSEEATVVVNVKLDPGTNISPKDIQNIYNATNAKALKVDVKSNKKSKVFATEKAVIGDMIIAKIKTSCTKKTKAKLTIYFGNAKAKLNVEVLAAQTSGR